VLTVVGMDIRTYFNGKTYLNGEEVIVREYPWTEIDDVEGRILYDKIKDKKCYKCTITFIPMDYTMYMWPTCLM